ncbi:MAG: HAMP domain-containing protein, partial [Gammaproteobacteria bacterium]
MGAPRERAGYRVERQLLALLSVFACLALAALASSGLGLIKLPIWVLMGVVAACFTFSAWLIVRLLRRRFALLNRLEQLTRRITRGDYGQRVTVRPQDEFQSLGNAFNEMTDQLQATLKSSQSVADIDRLILSSADLDTVVRKVLLTAQ